MIKHVVLWQLINPTDATYFKAQLDSCANLVDGTLQFETAIKTAGLEGNCDVILNASFASLDALDAYQNHPKHKLVGAKLGKLRTARYVMDYEA